MALTMATQSLTLFTAFMPSFTDIRKASPDDPEMRADVRMAALVAGGLALAVGLVAANVTGKNSPLLVSVAAAVMLIIVYEYTLANGQKVGRTNGTA